MTTATGTANTVLDHLVDALVQAGSYNRNDQSEPVAILWPDPQEQWASVTGALRQRLPLLTLGTYGPEEWTGPAYWIRCAVDGALTDIGLPAGVPVVYLPRVARQDLRAVEQCPRALQPIAEVQYRGNWFTQRSGREWTPRAFLLSTELPVAGDHATTEALSRALTRLVQEPISRLRRLGVLDADDFDGLLAADPVRSLLQWIDDPEGFKGQVTDGEWAAFTRACRTRLGFDPATDGALTAAGRLGDREGEWSGVWTRYAEAATAYRNIPHRLRQARPQQLVMHTDSWPQDNEDAEDDLRHAFVQLASDAPDQIRGELIALEERHGRRRESVWASLGATPLANSLLDLLQLASATRTPLTGQSVDEIGARYADGGWRADAATLKALASVQMSADSRAVEGVVDALYRPWLDDAALAFQRLYDGNAREPVDRSADAAGTCVVFVDGMRLDVAHLLEEHLSGYGEINITWQLAPVPTVTATGKPAASPVASQLGPGDELGTVVQATGRAVVQEVFTRLLTESGYQVLAPVDTGDPTGRAWTEGATSIGWATTKAASSLGCSKARFIRSLIES